ncbi:MAG: hypothetical protein ACLP0J_17905 [Solirubrobacteraceae bacterium]
MHENIDTSTPPGGSCCTCSPRFRKCERELLGERILAGLQAARARGPSRRPPDGSSQPRSSPARSRCATDTTMTMSEIAITFGVSRSTLCRQRAPTEQAA